MCPPPARCGHGGEQQRAVMEERGTAIGERARRRLVRGRGTAGVETVELGEVHTGEGGREEGEERVDNGGSEGKFIFSHLSFFARFSHLS